MTSQQKPTILLASKSPRRAEILRRHGVEPVVMPTKTDETLPKGIGMEDAVMFLALKKGLACLESLRDAGEIRRPAFVLAADTIVYKDGIMGKPKDRDDALRMLRRIRGTSHDVATGVALLDVFSLKKRVFCDVTRVYCKAYSDEDIARYVDEEKPYDKAGAYAIQEGFGKYVDHIDGDIETVIGLPFERVREELQRF